MGTHATAIDAKSIAGGGGNAKGAISASALSTGNVAVTVGGTGGAGGTAGKVSVTSEDALSTAGDLAHGIVAQSHGGTGGEGGWAAEASFTGGEVSGEVSVTIGGGGGAGGTGGMVEVTTTESITTGGFRSHGVLAQSIGGNGGNGGNVYSGNFSFSELGSVQVNVELGGKAGSGGKGGEVEIGNGADINTDGFFATGILAQSIGGNGGSGGNVYTVVGTISGGSTGTVGVSVGGNGGTGNDASTVMVENSGKIVTQKGGASAIHAASVGGGGGRAGNAANLNLDLTGSGEGNSLNATVNIQVGGKGGAGGDGDEVTVKNTGAIFTSGASAKGVVAQSTGGGGGDGGTASSYSIGLNAICTLSGAGDSYLCKGDGGGDDDASVMASLNLEIGGSGGASGAGGAVMVENEASISTTGRLGHAIVAHSHGGGGGNGGEGDLGVAGWTTNKTAEEIAKLNKAFTTIPSFTSIGVGVGGSGGASGDGGPVKVTNTSLITTTGDHAYGIHAQSVGGGGGNGGAGSTGLWSLLTIGGRGSGGGDGKSVTVSSTGTIGTAGDGGVGIFAQSVGGGGGTAGDVEKGFTASWLDLNIGVGVGIQLDAGAGGNGGDVNVTSSEIITRGDLAHGIVAQSVGGSGGVAGISGVLADANAFNLAGSAGDAGDSGAVVVTVGGAIDVSGGNSHGVFAQSASGSKTGDTSGQIAITVNADIIASGTDGRAILAQSASAFNANNGTIGITVAEGATVSTGEDGDETIGLFDGSNNSITNNGTIRHEGTAADDYVIRTNGVAALGVQNNGTIEGSVLTRLKSGDAGIPIVITNASGATFGLGATMTLGTEGSFDNSGTMSARTVGTIGSSAFTGDLSQDLGGTLHVDFDFGGGNDLITVEAGAKPALAGIVLPDPQNTLPSSGTNGIFPILVSRPGIALNALTVASTSTIDYSLTQEAASGGGEEISLGFDVDYTPWNGSDAAQAKVSNATGSIITSNHTGFGNHVDDLVSLRKQDLASGANELAFIDDLVLYLLELEEVADLVDVFDRFAPGEVFAGAHAALFSSGRFAEELNSCPALNGHGKAVFTEEGNCAWMRFGGIAHRADRDGLRIGYDENVFSVSAGAQSELAPGWFGGLAFGYERFDFDNARVDGTGNRFHAGAVLKREIGATTLSGAVSGGVGPYELRREVITPGGPLTAEGDPTAWWVAGHARAAHAFDLGERVTLEPWFDVGVTHISQDGYSEAGAGPFGLDVDSFDGTLVTLNPAIDVGVSFDIAGMAAEAKLRAGALAVLGDDGFDTTARLVGVAGAEPSYAVASEVNEVFADLGAAIEAQVHERATIEASFDALISGDQQEYIGAARINILF